VRCVNEHTIPHARYLYSLFSSITLLFPRTRPLSMRVAHRGTHIERGRTARNTHRERTRSRKKKRDIREKAVFHVILSLTFLFPRTCPLSMRVALCVSLCVCVCLSSHVCVSVCVSVFRVFLSVSTPTHSHVT